MPIIYREAVFLSALSEKNRVTQFDMKIVLQEIIKIEQKKNYSHCQ